MKWKHYFEVLEMDGSIILKSILNKYGSFVIKEPTNASNYIKLGMKPRGE
jgi:hypothetical protein